VQGMLPDGRPINAFSHGITYELRFQDGSWAVTDVVYEFIT